MNPKLTAAVLLFWSLAPVFAQTSVFTYQGSLGSNGAPTSGLFDFQFTLYDSTASTNPVGGPVTNAPLAVSNGLFTASLDFGAGAFDGSERWLQVGVRAFGDTNAYVSLSPRQLLTATPYALRAAKYSGPVAAATLTGTIADSQLSTNVALLNSNVTFTGSVTAAQFLGDGGGLTNVPATNPDYTPTGGGTSTANHSYIATNDVTAAVVVLPPSGSLQPGDTIRVTGAGLAGYYVQQNAGQTIELRQLDDTFGLIWQTNRYVGTYYAVAVSADGKTMVAANSGGVLTSTDYGVTWAGHGIGATFKSVACSGDGQKMVGCVNGGQIYTSINSGTNWTARDAARLWTCVASSFDGGKLIATTDGPSGQVYTSEDSGVTWTSRLTFANSLGCACSASGSNIVAVMTNLSVFTLATSTNGGLTWSQQSPTNIDFVQPCPLALSADGTRLLAGPHLSPDFGTTWIDLDPNSAPRAGRASCSADGSRVSATYYGSAPASVPTSEVHLSGDSGFTWSLCPLPHTFWYGVACSADGSTVVAAGVTNAVYICRPHNTTGTAGYLFGGRLSSIELQYLGNGVFMPISHIGTLRWK